MFRLDHDDGAARIQLAHQRVGDLRGQPFLHLRAFGIQIDKPRDLRKPGDPAVLAWDVPDVRHPVERNKVVLAGGVQRNLLDQHHFVVLLVKGGVQHGIRIGVQPGEHLLVRPSDPRRGLLQPVPVGIFPDRNQQFTHRRFGARLVERRGGERGRIVVVRPRHRSLRSDISREQAG